MSRGLALAFALVGCGRIGFEPSSSSDAMTSGSPGPRWLRSLGAGPTGVKIAGNRGEVVAVTGFKSTLAIDGGMLSGNAGSQSSGVVRYDRDGTIRWTAILDATTICDMRGITMRDDDALVVGLTAGMALPAYGSCSVASGGGQEPIEIMVDSNGMQSRLAHWPASGVNAQGWRTAVLADGTIAIAGIYGGSLTIGSPLPTAGFDPNAFLARFADNAATPIWAAGLTAPVAVVSGPLASDGEEVCALGSFSAPMTLLGRALSYAGGTRDAWLARIDATGTARFVRAIGTSGAESTSGNGSIVTAPDGGCRVSIGAPGDLNIDALSFPASAGVGVLLHFDAAGAAIAGTRLPAPAELAMVNGRLYGAFDVGVSITIAGQPYTPSGTDVIVVELDETGPIRLVGAVAGAGGQAVDYLAAIDDDAVAVSVRSTGELVFGDDVRDSGAIEIHVIAALGLRSPTE